MTDADLRAALTDPQVLALTLYGEARGEHIEGKIAVGCVIRNRVNARRFGVDYRDVCLRKWAFSCWLPAGGAANYDTLMAAGRTLLRGDALPPVLKECVWIADGLISGVVLDRVQKATHYLTRDLFTSKPPAWAKGQAPVCGVGNHLFFAGIK